MVRSKQGRTTHPPRAKTAVHKRNPRHQIVTRSFAIRYEYSGRTGRWEPRKTRKARTRGKFHRARKAQSCRGGESASEPKRRARLILRSRLWTAALGTLLNLPTRSDTTSTGIHKEQGGRQFAQVLLNQCICNTPQPVSGHRLFASHRRWKPVVT